MWIGLRDLVLPAPCPACRREASSGGLCADCAATVVRRTPHRVWPRPVPPGLPPCWAAGPYAGPLKDAVISYKERGRYGLAAPLGARLATVVASAVPHGRLLLVPVPATAQAVRRRRGDHMLRLARRAVRE
ncbi:MAG: ComF family protein, partial [Micromonosporaceae bacterium]